MGRLIRSSTDTMSSIERHCPDRWVQEYEWMETIDDHDIIGPPLVCDQPIPKSQSSKLLCVVLVVLSVSVCCCLLLVRLLCSVFGVCRSSCAGTPHKQQEGKKKKGARNATRTLKPKKSSPLLMSSSSQLSSRHSPHNLCFLLLSTSAKKAVM